MKNAEDELAVLLAPSGEGEDDSEGESDGDRDDLCKQAWQAIKDDDYESFSMALKALIG